MSDTKVMISSTTLDLPDHRSQVRDACLRQGMFPVMMEHLPAKGADAVTESRRLVDEAQVYVGVFAHRYGHVPSGHDRSITEMEYERAVEMGKEVLVFLMHGDHMVRVADVDQGEPKAKLDALKARLQQDHVVCFFKSPEDLRGHVVDALSHLRRPRVAAIHYVRDIPSPPKLYIAHPYTLLQTQDLVGRRAELDLLTDWVARPSSDLFEARILSVVGIGGLGKSALTWKWFNEVAPHEMKPLAGRMWWSFYESDATFENFVLRALAYVKRQPREEVAMIAAPEREEELLNILYREPYLLALDGLERILIAYARADAASLADDDLDGRTENVVARALGPFGPSAGAFRGRNRLRKTADPRAGAFFRKLSRSPSARILVSTRLYPSELQTETGAELPRCRAIFLGGLTDDDAVELWRRLGVSGSRDALRSLFRSFENYPLLIRALAGAVTGFRRAPGDFDAWLEANPDFKPFDLPLIQRRTHVLSFALNGLGAAPRRVLLTLAAFRMPTSYDTLAALHTGPGGDFVSESRLDEALSELEDRGLVGWDRHANRYDLHPVVRGVTWHGLGNMGRRLIYTNLQSHFESLPAPPDEEIKSLDDLAVPIELYHTLIGLDRQEDAFRLFQQHLRDPLTDKLSLCAVAVDCLEELFPDGAEGLPSINSTDLERCALLAYSYLYSGRPGLAAHLWMRNLPHYEAAKYLKNVKVVQHNVAVALVRGEGALYRAEAAARMAILLCEKLGTHDVEHTIAILAHIFALRGENELAARLFERARDTFRVSMSHNHHEVNMYLDFARLALQTGDVTAAGLLIEQASDLASIVGFERLFIQVEAMRARILLDEGKAEVALDRLLVVLTRARSIRFVNLEIEAGILLARAYHERGDGYRARQVLEDVWEPIERGPFRLARAEALRVLATIELLAGDRTAAVEAAREAYRVAWCDGPPFACAGELRQSGEILARLEALPPQNVTPFAPAAYDPMPELPEL